MIMARTSPSVRTNFGSRIGSSSEKARRHRTSRDRRETLQMIAEAREISKSYAFGATTVTALRPSSFSIASGEFLAILGPSGSGKSTLMNIIGLLDRPSVGEFRLNG